MEWLQTLKKIVEIVHEYDIPLLVDEAHGPHLRFSEELPLSARKLEQMPVLRVPTR